MNDFEPIHINMKKQHSSGNNGKGRFFIIPGSSERAKWIATTFLKVEKILYSNRGHDVYLGTYDNIDIGVVSTGMGCPSLDIIVTELILLGVRHFLRIGTCGSMNDNLLKVGEIAIATAAVRDEHTSLAYLPIEIPAVSNNILTNLLSKNIENSKLGIFHTKDSLFAREYSLGPLKNENQGYISILKKANVIASEMETSHLFILGLVHNVVCSSVCLVLGSEKDHFGITPELKIQKLTQLVKESLDTIKSYCLNF